MYNLPLAIVGEDQLPDGVVKVAIFEPPLSASRTNMWR